MKLYDLTLKKEVARECAWGVMGTITRIENKKGESPVLSLIEKEFCCKWEKEEIEEYNERWNNLVNYSRLTPYEC